MSEIGYKTYLLYVWNQLPNLGVLCLKLVAKPCLASEIGFTASTAFGYTVKP